MELFLTPLTWYYENGTGPYYIAMLCGILLATFIPSRLVNMFRTYVKTGSTVTEHDDFMDNMGKAVYDYRQIPKLLKDLYLNTDTEELFFDSCMFFFVSIGLLLLGGIVPYAIVLLLAINGFVKLARYMRRRVEMKEEFIARLKGEQ